MQKDLEIEATFYCKISNPEGLTEADYFEEHVQYEAGLMDETKVRVRKVMKPAEVTPHLYFTAKVKNANQSVEGDLVRDTTEYTTEVDESFLQVFEQIYDQKLVKTRYHFKDRTITLEVQGKEEPLVIDNVGFEVDIFHGKGHQCEWAKVDIEFDNIIDYLDKHYPELKEVGIRVKLFNLPFGPTDVINPDKADDTQKAIIRDLWDNHYTERRSQ